MTNARILKNNGGFSLVELMVVVAIIGILATVAIPSVSKYMAKARQTEAKTNLASLYSSNKAFFVEYSGYGTHFAIIGHAPEGQLRYNYGFQTAMTLVQYQALNYNGALPAAVNGGDASQAFTACNPNGNTTATMLPAAPFRCILLKEGRAGGVVGAAVLPIDAGTVLSVVTQPAAGVNAAFEAGAAAILDPSVAVKVDRWSMNQDKVLANDVPGV